MLLVTKDAWDAPDCQNKMRKQLIILVFGVLFILNGVIGNDDTVTYETQQGKDVLIKNSCIFTLKIKQGW